MCTCFVQTSFFVHTLGACFVCDTCILKLKMLSPPVWAQLRSMLKTWLYCSKVFTSLHGCAAFLPQLLYVSFSSTVYVFSLIVLRGNSQSPATVGCISSKVPFCIHEVFQLRLAHSLELKSFAVMAAWMCCLSRDLLVYFHMCSRGVVSA